MQLRSILFFILCLIALAPLALFWFLPNSRVMDNELETVRERHLLIANSLASQLSNYHEGLVSTFEFAVADAKLHPEPGNFDAIFGNLGLLNVCSADSATGKLKHAIRTGRHDCPDVLAPQQLEELTQIAGQTPGKTVTTGVVSSAAGTNVFYLLLQKGQDLSFASVETDYLSKTASRIKFGKKGHAAIVDRNGRALAHPIKDWENDRVDLSKVSIVQKMLSGRTGVDLFYSPALKEELVAGYAFVEAAGWGVMIPQPVSELQAKVNSVKSAGLTVMIFGIVLAAFLSYFASKILTDPIGQMVRAMHRIGAGELRAYEGLKKSAWHPHEFTEAREAIKAMSMRLQENIDTISRHAYLDGITGLPNRECFRVLAQEEIDKMQKIGRKCAILFLDLDGFKQVNDVYGHRSGDDLLKGFAAKLHLYCGTMMKRNARGAETALRILPARLGGDEFVVLLSNLHSGDITSEFASGLFSKVFGLFKIHKGVSLQVSGSVGGAIFPDQGDNFDELLRLADIAMYEAKNNGKGRFCLYSYENDGVSMGHATEPDLQAMTRS